MKKNIIIIVGIFALLFGARFFMDMRFAKMAQRPHGATVVEITTPRYIQMKNTKDAIGRVEAKYTANILSRVPGYLQDKFFKEGDRVSKGQLLFKIQPSDFIVAVNQAKANVNNTKANFVAAEKNLKRVFELVEKDYISKSQYDNALAERDSLKAGLDGQKALLDKANLDLSYTSITSPINGRIGAVNINKGNYINLNSGVLATIVSLDPIYVSFNVNPEDYISTKQNNDKILIELKLPNGTVYEEPGVIDFHDNVIDQTTGTVKLRAVFKNSKNILLPGQFADVKMISQKTRKKLIIPQESIIVNPGGKFVYVVDKENTAKIRAVKTGIQINEDIVIEEGLEINDKIIVKGLQKIRPDSKVEITAPKQEVKEKKEGQSDV